MAAAKTKRPRKKKKNFFDLSFLIEPTFLQQPSTVVSGGELDSAPKRQRGSSLAKTSILRSLFHRVMMLRSRGKTLAATVAPACLQMRAAARSEAETPVLRVASPAAGHLGQLGSRQCRTLRSCSAAKTAVKHAGWRSTGVTAKRP